MNRESGPSSAMGANSPCWTDAEMQILLSGLRQFERWSPLRNVLFTKLETHLQVHGIVRQSKQTIRDKFESMLSSYRRLKTKNKWSKELGEIKSLRDWVMVVDGPGPGPGSAIDLTSADTPRYIGQVQVVKTKRNTTPGVNQPVIVPFISASPAANNPRGCPPNQRTTQPSPQIVPEEHAATEAIQSYSKAYKLNKKHNELFERTTVNILLSQSITINALRAENKRLRDEMQARDKLTPWWNAAEQSKNQWLGNVGVQTPVITVVRLAKRRCNGGAAVPQESLIKRVAKEN